MAEIDKKKLREIALANMNKKYGKNTVVNIGLGGAQEDIDCIGTGIMGLDLMLSQSMPKGRIVEIYGPESSGKTTLTLHVAAEAQKQGGNVLFVDAEHALDLKYAKALGVQTDDLDLCQPNCGEQGLDVTIDAVQSGAYDLVIVDSVAALTPKAELEGEMGDNHVGRQARMMSMAMRKLTHSISASNCLVIFINQLRMKIGVMFGNPETTTGGNALKFYASQRLDVRKQVSQNEKDKNTGEIIANEITVKSVKNKMGPPFRTITLDIEYGKGISVAGDLLNQAVKFGLIEKAGAWYKYQGDNFAQGKTKAKAYIEENEEFSEKLRNQIKMVSTTGELPAE